MIDRILHIWSQGGWVMWPLLGLAILMFLTAVRLWLNLNGRQFRRLPESEWKSL